MIAQAARNYATISMNGMYRFNVTINLSAYGQGTYEKDLFFGANGDIRLDDGTYALEDIIDADTIVII